MNAAAMLFEPHSIDLSLRFFYVGVCVYIASERMFRNGRGSIGVLDWRRFHNVQIIGFIMLVLMDLIALLLLIKWPNAVMSGWFSHFLINLLVGW